MWIISISCTFVGCIVSKKFTNFFNNYDFFNVCSANFPKMFFVGPFAEFKDYDFLRSNFRFAIFFNEGVLYSVLFSIIQSRYVYCIYWSLYAKIRRDIRLSLWIVFCSVVDCNINRLRTIVDLFIQHGEWTRMCVWKSFNCKPIYTDQWLDVAGMIQSSGLFTYLQTIELESIMQIGAGQQPEAK